MKVQEIIEFPGVVYDVRNKSIMGDAFHLYVLPSVNPTLSEFCKGLTGIEQEWVDKGVGLEKALGMFDEFLRRVGVLERRFMVVTCGDFDMRLLKKEASVKKVEYAEYLKSYINLKKGRWWYTIEYNMNSVPEEQNSLK